MNMTKLSGDPFTSIKILIEASYLIIIFIN